MRCQDTGFSQRDSEGLDIEFMGTLPGKTPISGLKRLFLLKNWSLYLKTANRL